MATVLRNLRITRVATVDRGANYNPETGDGAHILLYKRDLRKSSGPSLADVHVPVAGDEDQRDEYEKATLTSGQRNALPDSAFAAVWTDATGAKQRKLPFKRADGSIDSNHLGAARGRIAGTPMPPDVKTKAQATLDAAAKENSVTKQNTFLKRLTAAIVKAFPPAKEPAAGDGSATADQAHAAAPSPDLAALKEHHTTLGKVIEGYGDASKLPADHPVHSLKKLHADIGKSINDQESKMAAAPGALDDEDPLDGIADDGCDPDDEASVEMAKSVEKRLNARFEKRMASLQKVADAATAKAAAIEKKAQEERDARSLEGVKVELTKFARVGVNVEKMAPKLTALRTSDPDAYTEIVSALSGADEQLRQSALYKNFGAGGAEGDASADAWGKIEAKAESLVQKDGKLTKQQAIAKVVSDPKNKALVNEYYRSQQ